MAVQQSDGYTLESRGVDGTLSRFLTVCQLSARPGSTYQPGMVARAASKTLVTCIDTDEQIPAIALRYPVKLPCYPKCTETRNEERKVQVNASVT